MKQQQWQAHFLNHGGFKMQPHPFLAKFMTELKHRSFKQVLDLGCGSGNELLALAENGFVVLGIDFAPAAVDLAQKRLMEKGLPGRAAIADMHEEIKAIKDNSYDACIALNSLNYQTITEFRKILKQLRRILKPNGLLLLSVPSRELTQQTVQTGMIFKQNEVEAELKMHFNIITSELDETGNIVITAIETLLN